MATRFVRRFARWDSRVADPLRPAFATAKTDNPGYAACGHLNRRLRIRCLRAKGHRANVHANGGHLW